MNLDLNLLRVFEALYEERSVTRASHRLGVTQSAVSHSLGRLRHATGNQLFLRVPKGLEPTPMALAMAPNVLEALRMMRQAFTANEFDPATTTRRFNISAGPSHDQPVIAPLIADLAENAPAAAVSLSDYAIDLIDRIDTRKVDVAIGGFSALPDRMKHRPLFSDEFVWIARSDHSLAGRRIDRRMLAEARRVQVQSTDRLPGIRGKIQDHGLERRIVNDIGYFQAGDSDLSQPALSCYSVRTAIDIVSQGGLVAYVPRRLAPLDADSGIIALDIRDTPETFTVSAIWRRDFESDPALLWLVERIVAVTAALL